MPSYLQQEITALDTDYNLCYLDFQTAYNSIATAGGCIFLKDWTGARDALYNASDYLMYAMGHFYLSTSSISKHTKNALQWINDNWPTAGAVTMDAILSAMVSAKFSQLQYFIGIEDAYRVALWNAPFNADFYAALARGFQKWP